jgi:AhpD family alkylhydroperoxidase
MTTSSEDPVLSEKEQELIAVAASVASGCLPCVKFHLRAAAGVGAAKGEILQAVDDATRVRRTATGIMAAAGGLSPDGADQAVPAPAANPSRIRELTAIAAAYAVSCSTGLETHMKAARALGATDGQMFAAIRIACAVGKVAGQKAKAMAGAILGVSEEEAIACDCDEAEAPSAEKNAGCDPGKAPGGGDCGCRPAHKEGLTNFHQNKGDQK